ncbi:MAG: hypothetical protein RJB66_1965 [Pseudomonadota bacterium]
MSLKKSVFSRSVELAKMTVKLGLKEIQSGQLQSRIDQAKILAQSLSQLKGAAMKAGQLMSLELADYFPPEAVEILSQLQNNASALPFDDVLRTLIIELGPQTVEKFQSIQRVPKASASIAQIHEAYWENQKLALKIQHPGVAESIDSDLSVLEGFANTVCLLTQRQMDLKPLFSELREVLKQEVDFEKEAKLLLLYREKLMTLKKDNEFYFAPNILPSLCTKKVLTMTWEEGDTLTQWLKSKPTVHQKEQLAHLILNLYCHEFYDWGLVQTDPNFSNFLVRPLQEDIGLVLLDFGSTRHYERSMIHQYVDLVRTVQEGKPRKILQSAFDFGLLDTREPEETQQLFVAMMNLALEPFTLSNFMNKHQSETFDFANSDYAQRSQALVSAFVKNLKYTPPPHRIIFLHRKLGGIFALLRRLEVKLNLTPYWEMMLEKKGV